MIDYTKHDPRNLAQDWQNLGRMHYDDNTAGKDYFQTMKVVTDNEFEAGMKVV